jgi:hypothetical protein
MDAAHRTGSLMIRVWLEEEFGAQALRARITHVLNVSTPSPVTVAVASEEEIVAIIRSWLRAFAATR